MNGHVDYKGGVLKLCACDHEVVDSDPIPVSDVIVGHLTTTPEGHFG